MCDVMLSTESNHTLPSGISLALLKVNTHQYDYCVWVTEESWAGSI